MRSPARHLVLPATVLALALVGGACSSSGGGGDTATTTQGADPLLIQTDSGPVQGAPSAVAGVRHFLDIPFAAAPTGDNAWRPPQPTEPWDTPLDATDPGPSCPQASDGESASFLITPAADPDCLHLNVWSPDGAEGLPVMVWIHGGSLVSGSAAQPYYTGDDLAAEGVIVVSMNYRLGPQGFLATQALAEESDDGAVGNYGFLDQQAGLEWVQANIAGLGGDPDNVTVFGESAGGFSACAHLAAPSSQGLFAKMIIESGGGCDSLANREQAIRAGERFMASVGCDDMACLRGLSDDALVAASFEPALVADDVMLSETGQEMATQGALDDTPVLIGSNADEATLFTLGEPEPTDADLVGRAATVTDDPEALVGLYPPAAFDSNLERLRAIYTDVTFTCPTLAFGAVAPEAYVYHFTYVSNQFFTGLGATHGFEVAPLFAHPEGISTAEPVGNADDQQVSEKTQAAWTAFATNGDPGPGFDPYADSGLVTLIDVPFTQVDEIRDGRCDRVTELTRGTD